MSDFFAIQSRDDAARLELRRHSAARLNAGLHAHGLEAETVVGTHMFQGIGAFFTDLATHWQGWQGERVWQSLDGELQLAAKSDRTGHVYLQVDLRDAVQDRWRLTAALVLEAGQLDLLATTARAFEDATLRAA